MEIFELLDEPDDIVVSLLQLLLEFVSVEIRLQNIIQLRLSVLEQEVDGSLHGVVPPFVPVLGHFRMLLLLCLIRSRRVLFRVLDLQINLLVSRMVDVVLQPRKARTPL